jgi:hypothetical protein
MITTNESITMDEAVTLINIARRMDQRNEQRNGPAEGPGNIDRALVQIQQWTSFKFVLKAHALALEVYLKEESRRMKEESRVA